jgi:hypothetical protein
MSVVTRLRDCDHVSGHHFAMTPEQLTFTNKQLVFRSLCGVENKQVSPVLLVY